MKLLDTNAVIAIINKRPESVRGAFEATKAAGIPVGISSIVVFELRYGTANSKRKRLNDALVDGFLAGAVEKLPFDDEDAARAGVVRALLAARGTPIGPYDVLIAGQALRHGATLVTANVREFARVPGLKVEDWGKG